MFRISAPAAPVALLAGLVAAAAVGLAAAAPASAATTAAIGPNQYFVADVDGQVIGPATIQMACFGPVYQGETGHPAAGQYVEVLPPTSTTGSIGYTGSLANAINVAIVYSQDTVSHVVPVGTVTAYGMPVQIPTSLVLPCYGSGTAVFDPTPTSATAKAADLAVNFAGQP